MARLLPHEIKSLETQKTILDAAERMLAEGDFRAVTVRNICQESGAAYGSFYHHFGTKEKVIAACCERLFEQNMAANPCPDTIDQRDFVSRCLWYAILFGKCCEALGKELVRYLYLNSDQGDKLFSRLFEEGMYPQIEWARRNGYVAGQDGGERMAAILRKDSRIACVGTVLWWCCLPDSGQDEPLHETMEHQLFHQMIHTVSEKFQKADFVHNLLTHRGLDSLIQAHGFGQ